MDEAMRKRCNELFAIGLRFNGDSYVGVGGNKDVNFHYTEIMCDDDIQWSAKIDKVKKELERRESIRISEVPNCSKCGKTQVCDDELPCPLEDDRAEVKVF